MALAAVKGHRTLAQLAEKCDVHPDQTTSWKVQLEGGARPEARSIEFEIEDLYFNFEGLPEYRGPKPGRIVLEGVDCVEMEIHELKGAMRVYEFSLVNEDADISMVSVSLWPYGKIEVTYRCAVSQILSE